MDHLLVDPGGFVLENLSGDLPGQVSLVRNLLANPQVWQQVQREVLSLDDPAAYRTFAAETQVRRGQEAEARRSELEEERAVRRNYTEVRGAVDRLAGELPEALRQVATYDMIRDLKTYSERHSLMTLPVQDIPAILAPRLKALGLDPVAVAARLAQAPASTTRSAAAAPAPTRTSAQRRPSQPTGAQLAGASARKRAAGAVPGAGAGSPSAAAVQPPRNPDGTPMGIRETVEWHRKQRASGGLYSRQG
jgi:hypothetical protein